MDWRSYITTDPNILAGKPIVRGTRLSVDFVLGLLAAGWSEPQVTENYPQVTPEVLRAVYGFAAEVLAEEAFYPLRRRAG
jgi:uncharacterized protein (DUF433 family)